MSKSITVVSLNLWRFYDWEKRLPVIISLLKEINPDIILTQETQKNIDIDPRNQIEILNKELGYPYTDFSVADIKHIQKGVPLKYPVEHGLGTISRFPITTKVITLKRAPEDKENRIVVENTIDIDSKKYKITSLHFSNKDILAENHFKETLEILEKDTENILIGDFNIFDIAKYKELYSKKYRSSSDIYDYVSYPEKDSSLDYILLPNKYEFEDFVCREEYVSDHRMIVAKIKLS
jgi:endonuclease/exonuclease/phosphatase family metal-dependent hydrolase